MRNVSSDVRHSRICALPNACTRAHANRKHRRIQIERAERVDHPGGTRAGNFNCGVAVRYVHRAMNFAVDGEQQELIRTEPQHGAIAIDNRAAGLRQHHAKAHGIAMHHVACRAWQCCQPHRRVVTISHADARPPCHRTPGQSPAPRSCDRPSALAELHRSVPGPPRPAPRQSAVAAPRSNTPR